MCDYDNDNYDDVEIKFSLEHFVFLKTNMSKSNNNFCNEFILSVV